MTQPAVTQPKMFVYLKLGSSDVMSQFTICLCRIGPTVTQPTVTQPKKFVYLKLGFPDEISQLTIYLCRIGPIVTQPKKFVYLKSHACNTYPGSGG